MSNSKPRYWGILYAVAAFLLFVAAEVFNRVSVYNFVTQPLFFICLLSGLYLAYRAVKIITRCHWAITTGLLIASMISIPFIREGLNRTNIEITIVPPIVTFIESSVFNKIHETAESEPLAENVRYLFNSAVWAEQQGQLELAIDFYQAALNITKSASQQARIRTRLNTTVERYVQANLVPTEALPSQIKIFVIEQ